MDVEDRLGEVFCGVLAVPCRPSRKRAREVPSHAFFYSARLPAVDGERSVRARPPAPPKPVVAPREGEDASAAMAREVQLMVELGLPAELVQGSAMGADRDGSQYSVLAVAASVAPLSLSPERHRVGHGGARRLGSSEPSRRRGS
jgi:hypothetical protein